MPPPSGAGAAPGSRDSADLSAAEGRGSAPAEAGASPGDAAVAAEAAKGPTRRPSSSAMLSEAEVAELRAEAAGLGEGGAADDGEEQDDDWAAKAEAVDEGEGDEQDGPLIVGGWLKKAGEHGLFRAYKNRYIVLDSGFMSYYHDRACSTSCPARQCPRTAPPRHSCAGQSYDEGERAIRDSKIPLNLYTVRLCDDDSSGTTFKLVPTSPDTNPKGAREWIFQAPTAEVAQDWVEMFRDAGCVSQAGLQKRP